MDIKKLVFDLVGCDFQGPVTEVQRDDLTVEFDGKEAVIGASTVPARARGYMLLAKAYKEGKTLNITQKAHFSTIGPMLDVSRGGVMKVASVKKYLDHIAALGLNMLMLYTEDTYEVEGYPFFGYQRGRYTLKELQEIDDYAYELGIEVIPCIQTLGHMEQFLRFPTSGEVMDAERVLLIGEEKTYDLIRACVATMRKAFRSNRIHIGCDEARMLGLGKYLRRNGYTDRFDLFNQHLERVTAITAEYGYHPIMWSDMYYDIADKNKTEGYATYVVVPQYAIDSMPDCDMVFWNYYNTSNDFYKINIDKHKAFNRKVVFSGGIWTQDGMVPNLTYTYDTMKPAMEECLKGQVSDIIITLWADDGCETNQMLGLPMMSLFSEYCWQGMDCTKESIYDMAHFMTGMTEDLASAVSDFFFGYEGAIHAGKLLMWSDGLLNLLYPDYDLPAAKAYLENGLKVIEKYAGTLETDYYAAAFRCCLHKCITHMELHSRYHAGDKAWLKTYAQENLPQAIADFEQLHKLHYELWHRDYKVQGFEQLMFRYAGAIERLKYTKTVIEKYLSGELSQIAELEPELAHCKPTKWIYANTVMYNNTK